MSVAQQDGIERSFANQISYEDLYRRWEQNNWCAYDDRLLRGPRGLGRAHRPPARVGALDLLDVLLRRGLGHRQPLPLHRRRAEGGAEVLPRDPAGRRGAPRRLLPPLLQGGDRRRRRHRLDARASPRRSSAGATATSSPGSTRWPTSCAATARCRSSRRRSRSTTWSSRRRWPSPASTSSRTTSRKAGTMPGFSAGMENVSRDEQRHIGFGVKVLTELLAESDECKAAVRRAAARGHALLPGGVRARRAGSTASTPALRLRDGGHLRVRA